MAHVAKPPMDKPTRKIKNGIRDRNFRTAEQTRRAKRMKTQMTFKHITLDFDGPVAILKLDHQEVMNAVSLDMLASLGEALDAVEEKDRKSVV